MILSKLAFSATFLMPITCHAEGQVSIKPAAIMTEFVTHMPKGEKQEIRVLTASINPGDRTLCHTHTFPVTLNILEGSFKLEMDVRPSVTISANQAMVEPTDVKMTGYNRSGTETMKAVIFYVSDPDAPFLHLIEVLDAPTHQPGQKRQETATLRPARNCTFCLHHSTRPG